VGAVGKSAGRGLVEGARAEAQADSSQLIVQEIAQLAIQYVDSAFQADLKPTIETTWAGVVDKANATIDRGGVVIGTAGDSLAVSVRGDLDEALSELLRSNIEGAGSEFREELRLISRDLRLEIQQNLSPAFSEAITVATRAFVDELSEGVRTELAADMEKALVEAVGSAVQAGTRDLTPVGEWIRNAGIAVALFASIIFLTWLYRDRQSSQQTVIALGQALQNIDDPEIREYLREQIRVKAGERNVLDWYRRFRKRRGIDR